MTKNTAGQSIGAQMINASTGAAFVGTVTVYITGDAGVQAIGTVGGGTCTGEGNGYFTYRPSQAETNYDLIAFTFVGTGAIPATIQVATLTTTQVSSILQSAVAGASPTLATLREIARLRLLEPLALTTPGSPLVSPQGTPGTSTILYAIVATNSSGGSDVSQSTVCTTGAATLNSTNFNRLTWQAVPGASGYDVYRVGTNSSSPTTTGKIGSTTTLTTFDDTGLAGDSSTAPTINTSGINSPFWTQQELLDILILGCKDLWRAIVDLHQGHFTTIDETNVSLTSGSTTLTGVPTDCFRILMIEPRDLTTNNAARFLYFRPKQYHGAAMQEARGLTAYDATMTTAIFYDILNAGSPVVAPSIVVAPTVNTTVLLRLVYVHVLPTLVESSNNPIPGESDNALISWTVAWARAKEREDHSPDPAWFATYATDKQSLLTALTPRQEQEEEEVQGMFEGYL